MTDLGGGTSRTSSPPGLPWPLATIDIEASSLDLRGYPIEVGIALWPTSNAPIFGWSTLIQPTDAWRQHGHWSPASAKVHGIRGRDLLTHGRSPLQVAVALNEALSSIPIAWCDGGPYDAHWLQALFEAGGVKPTFALGDWHRLASMPGKAFREQALTSLENVPTRHRARGDAEALLLALACAMNVDVGPTENLDARVTILAAPKEPAP